jgi:putative CocE/NonD family hydrolase
MRALDEGFAHLPLGDVIRHLTGEDLPLFGDQIVHHAADDPFWDPVDFSALLAGWTVPTLLVDGWYDYPCPRVLDDYAAIRDAGAPVRLRIGTGGHLHGGGDGGMTDAPLEWFDRHLRGADDAPVAARVTIEVQGVGGEWRDLPDWPPPATATDWFLQPGGALSTAAPALSEPDAYRYDPAEPTPSVGGIGMLTGGARDNTGLEARADVLVYTGAPLAEPLELIGAVSATVHLSSELDHFDVFVRLCDVAPDGASTNVCDGLQRFTPERFTRAPDGAIRVHVGLWPTAYRFPAGHRLRVQVSSGAHPVYARNLGTGEPALTATAMRANQVAIHHDPERPSHVTLPHAR